MSALAAQLYTVRQSTQNAADFAQTARKVRQIGYRAVQLSAHGPIDPKDIRGILDDNGLVCCATHVRRDVQKDFDAVVDEHRILGCEYPAIGSMPGAYRQKGREGYAQFAREQSEIARRFRQAGMTWGYHNHSFELEKFDGRTGLQILIDEGDPAWTFEIDTYWVQHGGGDPAAWIRKVKGRIPLVHFKDMAVGTDRHAAPLKQFVGEPEADFQKRADAAKWPKPIMAEIGEGNLNWPAIIAACRESGVRWYIVEQDTCQRDPFESLAISYRNLRAMGLE
jgi:sugar phosphate isomerase/epimerase